MRGTLISVGFQLCRYCGDPLVGYEVDQGTGLCESCWHEELDRLPTPIVPDQPDIVETKESRNESDPVTESCDCPT